MRFETGIFFKFLGFSCLVQN